MFALRLPLGSLDGPRSSSRRIGCNHLPSDSEWGSGEGLLEGDGIGEVQLRALFLAVGPFLDMSALICRASFAWWSAVVRSSMLV